MNSLPLVAVDIGNTRIKFAWFSERSADGSLPEPAQMLALSHDDSFDVLRDWFRSLPESRPRIRVVSVHLPARQKLFAWFQQLQRDEAAKLYQPHDLPLKTKVEQAERVGMDRLAAAVSVNTLRSSDKPAMMVDLGTALTTNLIDANGNYLGGAILPGMVTSAKALHDMTDQLPRVQVEMWQQPPEVLGSNTPVSIESGIFWGAVGTVREFVQQYGKLLGTEPEVFITGGSGKLISQQIAGASYCSHLTLSGVAFAAWEE